ncbi:hypothetical protein GCM10027347_60210 [Larkinella harenae]
MFGLRNRRSTQQAVQLGIVPSEQRPQIRKQRFQLGEIMLNRIAGDSQDAGQVPFGSTLDSEFDQSADRPAEAVGTF